jgi:hypothetical protein
MILVPLICVPRLIKFRYRHRWWYRVENDNFCNAVTADTQPIETLNFDLNTQVGAYIDTISKENIRLYGKLLY